MLSQISVVGLWHLGTVTSVCLADMGFRVVGFDNDSTRIARLNQGQPPIYEPGLTELLQENLASGRLSFTDKIDTSVGGAKYVFATIDTPLNENDEADISPIENAISISSPYFQQGCAIIINSQVPVGTCQDLSKTIQKLRPDLIFHLAYIPENLRLGIAIKRFKNPDMIVIGAADKSTFELAEELYQGFRCPKIIVDLNTAELIKHSINAYLAMQVSFMNEIANLSDYVGANALKVSEAMKLDPRIGGDAMLRPGLGFAGGTLARDLKILQKKASNAGCPSPIVDSILIANGEQNKIPIKKLKEVYSSLGGRTIAVFGLTYKPGTSTMRRSVSLDIIDRLVDEGVTVKAFDPKADLSEIDRPIKFTRCHDVESTARNTDALMFLTPWPEFQDLDFSELKKLMRHPVIIDAQNSLNSDSKKLVEMGYDYLGLGSGVKAALRNQE